MLMLFRPLTLEQRRALFAIASSTTFVVFSVLAPSAAASAGLLLVRDSSAAAFPSVPPENPKMDEALY
jgi:hypothetical protein